MRPFVLAILLALCLPSFCHSQANQYYEEGYVIQLNGDTVKGYLEKLTNAELSIALHFKLSLDEDVKATTYYPNDIAGFGFPKYELQFEPVEFSTVVSDSLFTGKRFAVLLLRGFTSVYQLELPEKIPEIIFDPGNTVVYVIKKNDRWHTLSMYERMQGDKHERIKEYTNELRNIVSDCPSADIAKIDNLAFTKKDITRFIIAYNDCIKPGSVSKVHKAKMPVKLRHGINASYSIYQAADIFNNRGFSLGYSVDLYNPAVSLDGSFTTGIHILSYQYDYTRRIRPLKDSIVTQKNGVVRVPLMGTYRIAKGWLAPFIQLGAVFHYSFEGEGTFFYTSAGAGFHIREKVMLAVQVDNLRGFFASARPRFIFLTAGYVF